MDPPPLLVVSFDRSDLGWDYQPLLDVRQCHFHVKDSGVAVSPAAFGPAEPVSLLPHDQLGSGLLKKLTELFMVLSSLSVKDLYASWLVGSQDLCILPVRLAEPVS